jgi:hypothetical protein
MTFEIKTPVKTDSWTSSDGKVHHEEEKARQHEVYLAVNPFVQAAVSDRYILICRLAKTFDFVPRKPAMPTGDPDFEAALTGTRCSMCFKAQYMSPSGITCPDGHGGAASI